MWCGVLCTWYGKRNVSLFSFKIKMEIHSVNKWYANRTTKQYFFRKTARILFQAVLIYQSGTCHKLSYLWLCLSTSLNRSFASVNSLFTWYYLGFNSWNVCRYWVHPTLFGKFHYDSSVLNILWHWQKVNVCFFSQSISNSNRYVIELKSVQSVKFHLHVYLATLSRQTNQNINAIQSDHLLWGFFSIGQWIFTPFLGPIITAIVVHNLQ